METFLRDLRYGWRMLRRWPGASFVAALALALGIGANTAIFSVVYAVLLRPLPVRDVGRLVAISSFNPRMSIPPINPGYGVVAAWGKQAQSFASMAAAWSGTAELATRGEAARIKFWRISATFAPTLGVTPALGRAFTVEEDQPGSGRVAMISYDLWQRRFGGDLAAVGTTIKLDGEGYAIIGVMPAGFHLDGKPADVYAPIALNPADRKVYLPVLAVARLKPGITVAQAQAEMDTVAARLDVRKFGWRAKVWGLRDSMVQDVRLSLLVLVAAVGLVLLIACANLASLLLAKASARQQEIAVRAALGAGRGRLARQFLTESTLLALIGGAAGMVLAWWLIRLVPLVQDERLPNLLGQTRIDGAVLAFTLLISLATGLIFGTAPAVSSAQTRVHETLKEGGRAGESRRHKRLWNLLVISETALALLLTIGATLLIRNFFYLRDVAPGFRIDGLLTASISPAKAKYPQAEALIACYRQVLENVRAIPGVASATLASTIPLGGENQAMSVPIEGHTYARPNEWPVLWFRKVDADYFRTLEIPLRRGRVFTEQDRAGTPLVAVINETMARRFWPGENPIGKHIGKEPVEIIGVTADVRHQDATKQDLVEVFFPYLQGPPAQAVLAVRASGKIYRDPMALAAAVSHVAAAVDRDLVPARARTMLQIASDRLAPKRLTAALIACFAGLALGLAALGIYGVLAFSVAQRTHEIGVRMALGAPRGAVIEMLVGHALLLAAVGVGAGLLAALGLTRVLASLLYGVSATDPVVFIGGSGVLMAVAGLAAWIPARRAARLDPLMALRHE